LDFLSRGRGAGIRGIWLRPQEGLGWGRESAGLGAESLEKGVHPAPYGTLWAGSGEAFCFKARGLLIAAVSAIFWTDRPLSLIL